MKLVVTTVGQTSAHQPGSSDTTKYVRKHWSVFVGYYAVTSLAVGFGLAAAMLAFALFDSKHPTHRGLPSHAPLLFLLAMAGILSAVTFVIQLMVGPFVFTTDVVCRKCHTRLKVKRIPFFAGKYSRPPRCECGGKVEPACLWKPAVFGFDSIAS